VIGLDPLVELLDQLVLVREPVVGVPRGDPCLARDRAHRRAGVPALLEEPQGGVEDQLPGVGLRGGHAATLFEHVQITKARTVGAD
jgi:hypothetical protein